MSNRDAVFAGSIPEIYDRYLGPLIFAPYAADLADRLAGMREGHVLETAAGTGIVSYELAHRLAAGVAITSTDLNQPMLDYAAAKEPGSRITWRRADALNLPFADASFDAVVCEFGAMFFPDKVAAYREARRVLKPGGRFVFNVWDRIQDNEFADVVTEAVAALFPHDDPAPLSRAHAAWVSRDDGHPARTPECRFRTNRDRNRRPRQPRAVTSRSGDRLLPGNAAAQRNRSTRRYATGGSNRSGGKCDGGALRHRPGGRKNPGARAYCGEMSALVPGAAPAPQARLRASATHYGGALQTRDRYTRRHYDPASAVHHFVLHRVRDKPTPPPP